MKKHIVFDIDECLVSINQDENQARNILQSISHGRFSRQRQRLIDLKVDALGKTFRMAGFERPYLKDFLRFCQKEYEVHIWSAGHSEYVNRCVDYIFHGLERPKIVMTRDDKVNIPPNNYHKPLRKFFEKVPEANFANTIFIDDKADNFQENPSNGIVVPKYQVNPHDVGASEKDEILLNLWKWLASEEVKNCNDVRTLDKKSLFHGRVGEINIINNYHPITRIPVSVRKQDRVKIVVQ